MSCRRVLSNPEDEGTAIMYPPPHVASWRAQAVPLQARRGPEDSKKLRFPDFVTTAQDGGVARRVPGS